MVKREAFTGAVGQVLIHIGQISINRREIDPQAIRRAVQCCVRAGAGRIPRRSAGWRGGPLGEGRRRLPGDGVGRTRRPGRHSRYPRTWAVQDQVPRLGRPIHVVYGEPFNVPRSSWPRGKAAVAEWTEVVRQRLADHVVAAQALTGLPLPGPPKIRSALSTA